MMVCTISHQNYPEMVQDFTQVGRQRAIEEKGPLASRQRTANVQLAAGAVR